MLLAGVATIIVLLILLLHSGLVSVVRDILQADKSAKSDGSVGDNSSKKAPIGQGTVMDSTTSKISSLSSSPQSPADKVLMERNEVITPQVEGIFAVEDRQRKSGSKSFVEIEFDQKMIAANKDALPNDNLKTSTEISVKHKSDSDSTVAEGVLSPAMKTSSVYEVSVSLPLASKIAESGMQSKIQPSDVGASKENQAVTKSVAEMLKRLQSPQSKPLSDESSSPDLMAFGENENKASVTGGEVKSVESPTAVIDAQNADLKTANVLTVIENAPMCKMTPNTQIRGDGPSPPCVTEMPTAELIAPSLTTATPVVPSVREANVDKAKAEDQTAKVLSLEVDLQTAATTTLKEFQESSSVSAQQSPVLEEKLKDDVKTANVLTISDVPNTNEVLAPIDNVKTAALVSTRTAQHFSNDSNDSTQAISRHSSDSEQERKA